MNTGTYFNISRAYEVALLGNYSLTPVANLENYPRAVEDLPMLVEFYKDVPFKSNGDIFVEMCQPDYGHHKGEDMSEIHKRVLKAKNNHDPERIVTLAMETLMKTAYTRLDLPFSRTEKILDIACTIAKLEGKKQIQIEHVAEAIQYSYNFETDLLAVKTYTKEDIIPMLEEVMNMGMSLRQDQLNGLSTKSGKELLEDYIKKNL